MVGRTAALFLFVTAILTAMAAAVTVNPVWAYGPADPGSASSGGGAQWYVAFLDGAQRLVPPGWEFMWLGGTWTLAILVPVGLTGSYLLAALLYPFLEAWITGDEREHHLLDRPRNAPTRTALGMAGVTVYGVLWAAAGSDVLAFQLGLGLEDLVLALQVALVLGPLTALLVTRRICLALQRRDRETVIAGFETGWVVRRPGGGYEGKRRALGARTRAELAGFSADAPLVLRPDADGRIRVGTRIRAVLSRWFFGDRVPPVERWEAETFAGPPAVSPVPASPPPS
jgi:ubiquinol-cytochrome c reductase cytochrome b subunit